MKKEKINALAKYFGCECEFNDGGFGILTGAMYLGKKPHGQISFDGNVGLYEFCDFTLNLKDLSSLTQEDYERMYKDIYSMDTTISLYGWVELYKDYFDGIIGSLPHKQADWLRNHGYYLNEECIKEFVKLKE